MLRQVSFEPSLPNATTSLVDRNLREASVRQYAAPLTVECPFAKQVLQQNHVVEPRFFFCGVMFFQIGLHSLDLSLLWFRFAFLGLFLCRQHPRAHFFVEHKQVFNPFAF